MRTGMQMFRLLACVLLISIAGLGCDRGPSQEDLIHDDASITILWADWVVADYLEELINDFTAETGIAVTVEREPWSTFHSTFYAEMEKRGTQYDLVIGDSQWLGTCAVNGHYIELTKWMRERSVDTMMTEATVKGYAEYPADSGRYWAVPFMGDALVYAYRRDLFENPLEKDAFQKQYGYSLAVPETLAQLHDIAEFFTRPDEDLYGLMQWLIPGYDAVTMVVDPYVWSFGADLGDLETFQVEGILNSPEGVEGLTFAKAMYQFQPPNTFEAYQAANKPFIAGQTALLSNFVAFLPQLLDPRVNPYADVTDFFAAPAGPAGRFSSLGGQGISVVAYSPKKDYSFLFLEWFVRDDVQKRWAELGGLPCHKGVLQSADFLNMSPYNKAFADSMEIVKDFWVLPEYAELLAISQKHWYGYIAGETDDASAVMDAVAEEWERVLEYAGYYKE